VCWCKCVGMCVVCLWLFVCLYVVCARVCCLFVFCVVCVSECVCGLGDCVCV